MGGLNQEFAGPLWAPIPQERLEQEDRDEDAILCGKVINLPSQPPGLNIPEGETNVIVIFVDNPGGGRG